MLEQASAELLPWTDHTEVLIWMLVTGAMALEGETEQYWFIQQITTAMAHARVNNMIDLRTVLDRTLYVHKRQYMGLKKLVDKLAAMVDYAPHSSGLSQSILLSP